MPACSRQKNHTSFQLHGHIQWLFSRTDIHYVWMRTRVDMFDIFPILLCKQRMYLACWSISIISFTFSEIPQTISSMKILMILQNAVSVTVITMNLFIFCYFGEKITGKFAEVADACYCSHWYDYPLKQQKYAILMLIRTQRPFYFTGYFISACSLATFKAVSGAFHFFFAFCSRIIWRYFYDNFVCPPQIWNTAFSYFMFLRAADWKIWEFIQTHEIIPRSIRNFSWIKLLVSVKILFQKMFTCFIWEYNATFSRIWIIVDASD